MTTYSTLQADIAAWTARDDLSTVIPSIIRLAEAHINRKVRVFEQETEVDLEFTSATDYHTATPDGFLSLRSLINPDAPEPECEYLPPAHFEKLARSPSDGFSGIVGADTTLYTIVAGGIRILAGTGATDPVTLTAIYYKRFEPLSDSNTTNYLLTNHYDLYLFAALVEAWDYADEERQISKYRARVNGVVEDIAKEENLKRMGAAPLRRRPPDQGVV